MGTASQVKYPYTGKCLSIITGASKGFGRTIAQLLCHKEHGILGKGEKGSKIILMARNTAEMENTKILVENGDGNFDVDIVSVDLYDVEKSQYVINETLGKFQRNEFQNVFLFNNAGCLGDPSKAVTDYNNIEEIQKIYNLNVITGSFLISRFCKHFESSANRFVIQTSTLAALQPFTYSSMYSCTKACMDMFLRNLAADCPQVRALNYAPGPMDTDMSRTLWNSTGDEGTKAYFTGLFTEGKILKTDESAKKLMKVLRDNEFENGAHLDFFDL